ncbi:MAG: hypothetical protein CNE98_01270 [Bacteroidetes bacterium MED-G17]|nr:MAG: hypothetical protein CNE98_01270 [Bacteroidetes bacterium MED-G17]CAI8263981.1 MAG: Uncharacterised protein [Bacteroidetes bacterium MED-G17]|tara:strand:+ start:4416 stop:4829 length:414 start_codon:yes stop_codon:yes gene_type:complete
MQKNIRWAYYLVVLLLVLISAFGLFGKNINMGANVGLNLAFGLLAVGTLVAIAGFAIQLKNNPQNSRKSLMGIGIIVILCGICYAFASSEVTELYINNGLESASASKRVGGGLLLTYILGSIAIVVSILSGLIKSIR